MKVRLEFNRHDCWIGAYWKRRWLCADEEGHTSIASERLADLNVARECVDTLEAIEPGLITDLWICLIPCFPIHFTW